MQEHRTEPVHRAGAIVHEVLTSCGEQPQLGSCFIGLPHQGHIAPDAGLVGNDDGVFRVSLRFAAVGAGSVVNDAAGDVVQRLFVCSEDGLEKSGTAVIEVGGPRDVGSARERCDVTEESQDLRFSVLEPAGEQLGSVAVDDDAVVFGLAGIDTGPKLRHAVSIRSVGWVRRERPCRHVLTGRTVRVSQ